MADRLDFIEGEKLLNFLHRHKTQLSCMKKPLTFVRQLRDYSLISEEIYENMLSTQDPQTELYKALDWIENNKRALIHRFWGCVFEEHIIETYPTLKELQDKLFKKAGLNVNSQLRGQNERPEVPMCDDEQPGSSSDVTQPPQQGASSSPVPKKTGSNRILVTCEGRTGYMDLNVVKDCKRQSKSKCILVDDVWHTPIEFLRLAGKEDYQRWKRSIRYKNEPLEKYYLTNGRLRKKPRRKRTKKCSVTL